MVRIFGGVGRPPQSLKQTVKYCSSIGALVKLMSYTRMVASWQYVIKKGLFVGPAFRVALRKH
jgi:hypothetical protein